MTTEILFELLGILGFVVGIGSTILLARKREAGWYVRLVANIIWFVYGLAILSIANIISSTTSIGITIYAIYCWRRQRLDAESTDADWEWALERLRDSGRFPMSDGMREQVVAALERSARRPA